MSGRSALRVSPVCVWVTVFCRWVRGGGGLGVDGMCEGEGSERLLEGCLPGMLAPPCCIGACECRCAEMRPPPRVGLRTTRPRGEAPRQGRRSSVDGDAAAARRSDALASSRHTDDVRFHVRRAQGQEASAFGPWRRGRCGSASLSAHGSMRRRSGASDVTSRDLGLGAGTADTVYEDACGTRCGSRGASNATCAM